jgi:hypothetical protein
MITRNEASINISQFPSQHDMFPYMIIQWILPPRIPAITNVSQISLQQNHEERQYFTPIWKRKNNFFQLFFNKLEMREVVFI